ncbi:MAG: hypothetical protein Q9180_000310 [Flavoplaca navasiana]
MAPLPQWCLNIGKTIVVKPAIEASIDYLLNKMKPNPLILTSTVITSSLLFFNLWSIMEVNKRLEHIRQCYCQATNQAANIDSTPEDLVPEDGSINRENGERASKKQGKEPTKIKD